ncbi:PA2169 family four-helix-bundle protein [Spirosoma sp. BT702]|uniref:PA2169 family four-helix-bundle protein n=1 Tax=Spirosoma profusum TaxID=2771354 RepID=A0A927AN07_9BACT|nr:PA2169 family four-helix-bundle protein [Spirosoma profusum]MBD2700874.1 PA2169 family four-helix-bundle protein [Spirosoma profusum]
MINNKEIVDDLNDLVKINNDRIHGYEEAIKESKDAELNELFRHMVIQSEQFRSQLADHIVRIDGTGVADFDSTDISSQLHRAWIDIKAAITGKDRESILSSVEFGENAAVEAYEDAVEKDHLPSYIKEDLQKQLTELRGAYDRVKSLEKSA